MSTPLGYQPDFLGRPLPLPAPVSPTIRLDYPRFCVLLDPNRRLAAVTAVCIDGAQLLDLPRTGEWHLDDRAPDDAQAGPELYRANDLDRGHLVRRRDPGWGTPREATRAMEATFAYPNAAPQVAGFNQSKELWLGLEDHVLAYAQAERQRLAVFTAPVLAPDDPEYRGVGIPLSFWKIAAWSSDGDIAATGFLLEQRELVDRAIGRTAVRPLSGFRTFQVPLPRIAESTGIDLGPLVAADLLSGTGARPAEARLLRSADDIRLA